MKTTKKHLLLAFLLLFGFVTEAQEDNEIKFLFGKNSVLQLEGFGGPVFGFTQFKGNSVFQAGGQGGIILNRRLAIGLYGIGIATSNFTQNTQEYNLNGGHGGFFFEYIVGMRSPLHLSFPIYMGWGRFETKLNSSTNANETKTNGGLLIPGISVELNIYTNAILFGTASYRYFYSKSTDPLLSSNDISGTSFLFGIKFGKF